MKYYSILAIHGSRRNILNDIEILSYQKWQILSDYSKLQTSQGTWRALNRERRNSRLAFTDDIELNPLSTNTKFQSHFYNPQIDQRALISIKLQLKPRTADYEGNKLTSET